MKCYALGERVPELVAASPTRQWMDRFPNQQPYHCLPLTIANSYGWEILSPCSFSIHWNGGLHAEDIRFEATNGDSELLSFAMSHFSHGIVTFHTGYIFQTEPGCNLLASGPFNRPKDGISPLTGVIETDWLPYPFTMNWQLTRPGVVKFEKNEPFCLLVPVSQHLIEDVHPEIRDFGQDADIQVQYTAWAEKRYKFMMNFGADYPSEVKVWQKDYLRGTFPNGDRPSGKHIRKLRLASPVDKRQPFSKNR